MKWLKSTEGSMVGLLTVAVSVKGTFLRDAVVNPILNPQPGGLGAVVSLSSHLGPVPLG